MRLENVALSVKTNNILYFNSKKKIQTIKKRTMKEESNKKPAQKVLKSNTAAIKMESKVKNNANQN